MTIHFIGAGPGAPDLLTVRGLALIRGCPVVLYAGSLVPRAVIAEAKPGARVIDTQGLTLDDIIFEMERAHAAGFDVARVHTGDPSLYGAIAEQMRRLRGLGIPFAVVPGVPSFAAGAAALEVELTLPGVAQSVVVTRLPGRTPMPGAETLEAFAATGATLAIHLAADRVAEIAARLAPVLGPDCPAAVVERASWPEQRVLRGTLADIAGQAAAAGITRTALVYVGRALAPDGFADSRLYAPGFAHGGRPGG